MDEQINLDETRDLPMSRREATFRNSSLDVDTDDAPLVMMETNPDSQESRHTKRTFQIEQRDEDNLDKGRAPAPPVIPTPDYDEHGTDNAAFHLEEENQDEEQIEQSSPHQCLPNKTSAALEPSLLATTAAVATTISQTPTSPTPEFVEVEATPTILSDSIVEVNDCPSADDAARTTPKEELMFRLKMAHLAPRTVNWGQELDEACSVRHDSELPDQVLDSLREFPMSMSEKLSLSGHLRGKHTKHSSNSARTLARRNRTSQINSRVGGFSEMLHSDSFGTLGLWDKPIGKITAYFGTNVASYFKFLRFIAVINAWSAIVMLCFVSVPQIVPNDLINDDVRRGFFGRLSQTIFFYGAYSNTSIGVSGDEDDQDDSGLHYDRPLAYFLTWSCIYILSILFIVLVMYASYRRSKQSFSDTNDRYSASLLVGWDHSVTSKEGCRLKASALTTSIREMTIEDRERKQMTCKDRVVLMFVRLVCLFLCLAIMGGSGYFIYYVADKSMNSKSKQTNVADVTDFFEKYQLTILVSGLKVVIPPVLSLLLYFENWQPRTIIKIQLARTAVFYGASLLAFLISIYAMSTKCQGKFSNITTTPSSIRSSTVRPANGTAPQDQEYCCWENEVGEQIFQIVVMDFFVTVGVGLVMMAGRAVIVDRWFRFRMLGHAEFKVPSEILDLIYSQSLIWLGLYSSPFMALVGLIKLIIQFYFFYAMATYFCDPPSSVFRASRSGGFFRFVLLVTLFFCMFPLTYMVISLEPSHSCGPFKTNHRVYTVFTDKIGQSPDWLRTVLVYISTPAVVIPVILLLILLVFYYRVKSSTQKKTAKNIRAQFKMKRQIEKKQLFSKNRIQRATSQ